MILHYPPARFTVNPRRESSATRSSAWSPWISIAPSFTVPPVPQRRFKSPASALMASSPPGTPVTTVTVFPPRPLVSRRTRTIPSPAGCAFFLVHAQEAAALPQPGQTRPSSEDQTSGVSDALPFFLRQASPRVFPR